MGALTDFLTNGISKFEGEGVAIPAIPAIPAPHPCQRSQQSQESQGVAVEKTRFRLLALAEAEGVDAAHVHRLTADDMDALAGMRDGWLVNYLHLLERKAGMARGVVPEGWTVPAHCEGCGPVWLWPGAERVRACPWCFRRRAGKALPRPPVACGDCLHYLPDPLNPEAGTGRCSAGRSARWPMKHHDCAAMRPVIV